MAQPSNAARFTVAMAAAVFVVGATWMVRHPSDASLRFDNAKKVQLDKSANAPNEAKATGSFTIVLVGDDGDGGSLESSSQSATRFRLRGRVTAKRHVAAHEFNWLLPEGYQVVDGALRGTVPELHADQTHELSIVISRGDLPLQPIVLHVFKIVNSEPRGQLAQFDLPPPASSGISDRDPAESIKHHREQIKDHTYVQ